MYTNDNYMDNTDRNGYIVINYISSKWEQFDCVENCKRLNEVHKNLLFLEVFNLYLDEVSKDIHKGLENNKNPIKIDMTEIINSFARGVYNNGGTDSTQVYDLFKLFLASLKLSFGIMFNINHVLIEDHIISELSY